MDCVLQRKIMWEEDSEMRWLRFEMKGMVDVQFIFIGRGLKKIMPAALTFCIPKRVLITYSCSKQRSEALSCLSLNSSIYSGTLPSPPCLVWPLILQARFRKVLVFFFLMSSGNEEWRLWSWLKISMTNSHIGPWNEFYITF